MPQNLMKIKDSNLFASIPALSLFSIRIFRFLFLYSNTVLVLDLPQKVLDGDTPSADDGRIFWKVEVQCACISVSYCQKERI